MLVVSNPLTMGTVSSWNIPFIVYVAVCCVERGAGCLRCTIDETWAESDRNAPGCQHDPKMSDEKKTERSKQVIALDQWWQESLHYARFTAGYD